MFMETGLLVAGGIAFIGLLYHAYRWFNLKIGPDAGAISTISRFADFLGRLPRTLISWKFWWKFLLNVLLQAKLWKESRSRWVAHFFIAYGFTALLLSHALDDYITLKLFPEYVSTLNPWMALRNVLGLLVVIGAAFSLWRRSRPDQTVKSRGMDTWALVILALIMISGFLAEGAKIISEPVFLEMADEYGGMYDPEELRPLKAYWAKHYGVHFDELEGPIDEALLAEGAESNEYNCLYCHARPGSAFVSHGISRIMMPLGGWLNQARADIGLWYVHVIICLIGLALLPFTKLLHMLTSPLTLVTESPLAAKRQTPAYLANTRALALDACTHCGLCSEHCSVAPVYRSTHNGNILPSEKLIGLKALLRGGKSNGKNQDAFREGNFICTGCYKCTEVCPVGLNLQDLWAATKDELSSRELQTPAVWAKQDGRNRLEAFEKTNSSALKHSKEFSNSFQSLIRSGTFKSCFTCKTCSCSCPVVNHYAENANVELDLLPHQIIRSVAYGQPELALNARMLWDCMNCYMCQEHCPQGVRVCDIIYELKNMAYSRLAENLTETALGKE